ncbi:MAG TPA: VOC family protein [Chloroflexia bacterium]|nr:VOC family protein [Chloroflexia bacterium]
MTAETKTSAIALDFVVFYVSDLDASQELFAGKLGLTHFPQGDETNFRQFISPEGGISYGLALGGPQSRPAGEIAIYFKVADIEAERAKIVANGVEATPVVQMPFGKIFSVKSPDGHILTMLEEPVR